MYKPSIHSETLGQSAQDHSEDRHRHITHLSKRPASQSSNRDAHDCV